MLNVEPSESKELLDPVMLISITVQLSVLWLYLVIILFGKQQHLRCDEGHFPCYFHGQKMVGCTLPDWPTEDHHLCFSIRALKSVTENSKPELFVFFYFNSVARATHRNRARCPFFLCVLQTMLRCSF